LAAANRVRATLEAGTRAPDDVRRAVAALGSCVIPAADQLPLLAERAAAVVTADDEARKAPPDRDPVSQAINDAQTDVGSAPPEAERARAALRLELARYRAAVTGEKRDQEAFEALLAAEPDDDPADEEVTLMTALTEGPEAISGSVTGEDSAPLVPGPLGWVLLGAGALSLWGALLRRNARQLAGPVRLEGEAGEDVDLRIAVLQNLPEPGAEPGASTANSVTSLLDVAGSALGTVTKIVEAVLAVIGRRYGYTVYADIANPAADAKAGSPARTRVLVRVKDLRSEATLGVHLVEDDDTIVAVRAAGLWAAGFILQRSSRVPGWAAWDVDSAKALATSRAKQPDA
jgi:hypothetical protein